jgi:hypothetical protein
MIKTVGSSYFCCFMITGSGSEQIPMAQKFYIKPTVCLSLLKDCASLRMDLDLILVPSEFWII